MKGTLRSILTAALLLAATTPAWSADKSDKDSSYKSKTTKDATAAETERRDDKHAAASRTKININTADQATLETLPGVGPVIAQEIIAARPFKSVADLKNVKGIGDKRFEQIVPHVTITGSNTGRPAASTRGADKASQKSQRAIDQEATSSTAGEAAATTRGSDKASQRPQSAPEKNAPK